MDAGFHMYFEETDLFSRAASLGWRAAYVPEAEVVHYYGKSSEQNIAARHIRFNSSKVRYARKHFGPAVAEMLSAHLRLLFAMQGAEEGVKLLLGHRPELRKQRLREIRKVLAAGWAA
jgi:GT2 family glycosyltransferase